MTAETPAADNDGARLAERVPFELVILTATEGWGVHDDDAWGGSRFWMQPRYHVPDDDVRRNVGHTAGREWGRETALRAHQGAGPCQLRGARAAQNVPAMESDRIFKYAETDAANDVLRIVGDVGVFLSVPLERGAGLLRGNLCFCFFLSKNFYF